MGGVAGDRCGVWRWFFLIFNGLRLRRLRGRSAAVIGGIFPAARQNRAAKGLHDGLKGRDAGRREG